MTNQYVGGTPPTVVPGQEPPLTPPAQATPPVAPGTGTTPPADTPMTVAQFTAAIKELKGDLLHVISSQAGRTESQLKREVDQRIAEAESKLNLLKASGVAVTDEEFKMVRSQAVVDASLGRTPQAAQSAAAPIDPAVTEARSKLSELQARYGSVIPMDVPEFYMDNEGHTLYDLPPDKVAAAYEERLVAYNTRLGRPLPKPTAPAQPGNPTARAAAPSGGAAPQINPIADITDPHELIRRGLEERNSTR